MVSGKNVQQAEIFSLNFNWESIPFFYDNEKIYTE